MKLLRRLRPWTSIGTNAVSMVRLAAFPKRRDRRVAGPQVWRWRTDVFLNWEGFVCPFPSLGADAHTAFWDDVVVVTEEIPGIVFGLQRCQALVLAAVGGAKIVFIFVAEIIHVRCIGEERAHGGEEFA